MGVKKEGEKMEKTLNRHGTVWDPPNWCWTIGLYMQWERQRGFCSPDC